MTQNLSGPHMDLGAAAQGDLPSVDVEEARERLREVQAALAGLGFSVSNHEDPAHGVDGVWGPQTQQAVRLFQREIGIRDHGHLDEDTFAAILDAHADARAAESPAPTQDDTLAYEAAEVIRGDTPLSISEELGDPIE